MALTKNDNLNAFIAFIILVCIIIFSIKFLLKEYSDAKLFLNGRILCTQLMNASITYYKNNGEYLVNNRVFSNDKYPLDARNNPYFSTFSTYPVNEDKQGISVFGIINGKEYELKVVFNNNDQPSSLKDIKIQTIKH